MLARIHKPPTRSPMAGRRAGRRAGDALDNAERAIQTAAEAFQDGPKNDHTRDGLAALKRAERELADAKACAAYLRKGGA